MPASPSKNAAPCGTWPSPISAAAVAAGSIPLSMPLLDGTDVYWLAGLPAEAGRTTVMRRRGGKVKAMTPAPFNARSRVHEYGGGAFLAAHGALYFSHFADNRVYVVKWDGEPEPVTPAGPYRYADFALDLGQGRLIAVREDHTNGSAQPVNTICSVGLDGTVTVLASGHDFYSAPRVSPDGSALAFMSWDHPRMPWQGTQLWVADLQGDGTLGTPRLVAGGPDEAICQPEWSPAGELHFVSDRSGWWNLYAQRAGSIHALCPREAEFATPHWSFANSMYGFAAGGEIICTYIDNGTSRLARLAGGELHDIANPYQEIRELRVQGSCAVLLGGAPTIALEVACIDLATGGREVLARSIEQLPAQGYLSVPDTVSFPTSGGRTAHAFFYPPTNADVSADGSQPPLMVIGHGGPTGMASSTLKLATQFWTSRGFAVLDVNYGGSSGFGRAYRDALRGQWGVIDVDDCVAGARYVAERGLVDPDKMVIRGGSAGGLTVLCALAFHDVFKAGASYYGVSDLQGLDDDSHKFESHYNEYLIAPKPQAAALYRERSPIHHTGRLKRPMIFFQGLDDKVVPPQQSEIMVEALKNNGVPVAYMPLEGEGHGFRKSDSIVRTLEAELYFYLRIFGMAPAGDAPPVTIENLPA
ncbi:prolyl oligopeptidase family serine peptidase [Massilia sp. PAMC28688]|uniref:S9 family peptidase n=1 Tax=Massilia sp. PAMC28688 TaxID=2861283 RepID=UPI001C63B32E|nr:prolyl oligopeptidase family serine peptidase [Massilia sp. PAMC28688]QYF95354.1 prolyl oligopeptidase family serine peptidase [Massilia sp. PAMC28688]